jgi:hypothetical protein
VAGGRLPDDPATAGRLIRAEASVVVPRRQVADDRGPRGTRAVIAVEQALCQRGPVGAPQRPSIALHLAGDLYGVPGRDAARVADDRPRAVRPNGDIARHEERLGDRDRPPRDPA